MTDDLFREFRNVRVTSDPKKEAEEAAKGKGKALVVFLYNKPFVLIWTAGEYMQMYLNEGGASSDTGFSLEECGVGFDKQPDGAYIGDFKFVDDGPSDWPGAREVVVDFVNVRPATSAEWEEFLRGDWPFDPIAPPVR